MDFMVESFVFIDKCDTIHSLPTDVCITCSYKTVLKAVHKVVILVSSGKGER